MSVTGDTLTLPASPAAANLDDICDRLLGGEFSSAWFPEWIKRSATGQILAMCDAVTADPALAAALVPLNDPIVVSQHCGLALDPQPNVWLARSNSILLDALQTELVTPALLLLPRRVSMQSDPMWNSELHITNDGHSLTELTRPGTTGRLAISFAISS